MNQLTALKVLSSGDNVFLTGSPGSGKTYVLNKFVRQTKAKGKSVAVTATTGIAATHISGTTIHSWAGIGLSSNIEELDITKLKKNTRLVTRYKSTDILVIDEVSMLDSNRLDLISYLAKEFRKNERPFGGMQIVLVGDLFQLPPVSKKAWQYDYVYKAECWDDLNLKVCYLSEQHRQNGNDGFNAILESIRLGSLDDLQIEVLNERKYLAEEDSNLTKLYAHNFDVDQMNQLKLNILEGEPKEYVMSLGGDKESARRLRASILAPEKLQLKIDAEVMFVVNNPKAGYVNGSRGRVVEFQGDMPVVRLTNGKYVDVETHEWHMDFNNEVVATAEQLPLRLAWAITIHKSQGMSLDAAEVDLSHAFTPGMGYVALSRLRTLDGLYLKDINKIALKVNSDILSIDRLFRQQSAAIADI